MTVISTAHTYGDIPHHDWNHPAGRPRTTWMSQIVRDTRLTAANAWALADDRSTWRALRPTAGYAQQWVSDCNVVLYSVSAKVTRWLQAVLHIAAQLITGLLQNQHITVTLHDTLHWLPVPRRIVFKIALMAFDCVCGRGPGYFDNVMTPSPRSAHFLLIGTNNVERFTTGAEKQTVL